MDIRAEAVKIEPQQEAKNEGIDQGSLKKAKLEASPMKTVKKESQSYPGHTYVFCLKELRPDGSEVYECASCATVISKYKSKFWPAP